MKTIARARARQNAPYGAFCVYLFLRFRKRFVCASGGIVFFKLNLALNFFAVFARVIRVARLRRAEFNEMTS